MLKKLGIEIVKLDLPFRLNHVNCLLAEGETGWAIIDTGLHDTKTIARWEDILQAKKVSDLYISHYHPDHFGYAGGLQQKTGAKVSMTQVDEKSGKTVWGEEFIQEIRKNYTLSGVPDHITQLMTVNTEEFKEVITPYPNVDHYFQEGEKILFGQHEYEVIFTPGHADGLVVFYSKENSVLLSTDHILPRITPNIAYWFHGIENPLKAYMESLEKIKRLNVEFVIPSHGEPFYYANKRINEILNHHEERLAFVLKSIGRGITAYSLSKKLFAFEMDAHEQRFALGESIAHLEYLRYKGYINKEIHNGICWYYIP
ncbi:MBL fold metallo-hydrolase [Siminovitchia terrae]|uniref:MBL fold metallo-hydrolase n=1 Tax=Siminovitchia terrae TaxID=1914933 RepID=A0A429X3C2_SIMTE|nr:MBL fold metallo-hydrolase [Siminovitchia terrae]RST57863.1 MBL fold metallo-hydrolase [Siminovitchia terrae]GIN92069.1 MBL fold metallo-hydrolase [Siminovitchia terrae]GIN98304.1 MBL fold metallo-hydrolase [Siminovitchia terrae]